ncbi:hypothetical protein [Fodinicola feengrottensis]|uniref:hypothetical protein n=1 Tax=Fodinicola feengrottensis TaxID=435914 RepID=UPI0013D4C447|nr:hypothetical protein [Fodinicola feengrottensis]
MSAIAVARYRRSTFDVAGQITGCSQLSAIPKSRLGHDFGPVRPASAAKSEPQRSRKGPG